MSEKVMLINTVPGHECRIAILDDGRLEELYTERASSASQVGNIYKGRITNIEPSIQAAFVDFGEVKNGFLHISDLHPQHFPRSKKNTEQVGRRTAHRTRPPIQECLRRGQEIVIQMTKQGIGTKGPTLTTYLSIPGRLSVMMPGMSHAGISRKIEDEEVRAKLRKMLDQLEVPEDMGIIIRTAGVDRPKRELQRDLSYLSRLWKSVQARINSAKTPSEIYQESDLVIRTIRDVFDSDVRRIVCDSRDVAVRVKDFLNVAVPRAHCKIELYLGKRGLFDEFGVEDELQKVHSRTVGLKGGGSLVIDQTEALVAIDVNSGSFRAHSNAETNALKLNLQAADEIGRQLRLRDMGGVIIIDFVDMRDEKNRRTLERTLRDILKKDRAKSKVLKISNFGIVEMTRQRLRPSLKQSVYSRCSHCDGTGLIMTNESVALEVMRDLQVACAHPNVADIDVAVSPSVAHHLSNTQRHIVAELEEGTGKTVVITANADLGDNDVQITCSNNRGSNVAWKSPSAESDWETEVEIVDIRKIPADQATADEPDIDTAQPPADGQAEEAHEEQKAQAKTKKRRSRRGGRNRKKKTDETNQAEAGENENSTAAQPEDDNRTDETSEATSEKTPEKTAEKTSRRKPASRPRARRKPAASGSKKTDAKQQKPDAKQQDKDKSDSDPAGESQSPAEADDNPDEKKDKKPRRRGRRGGRKHRKKTDTESDTPATPDAADTPDAAGPKDTSDDTNVESMTNKK